LVADINNSIIDVNIGNNSYAFLVNTYGEVIASPKQDPGSDQYVNILNETTDSAYEVSKEIMSGKTGVTTNSAGNYFAFTPISSASWTLAIYVPAEDIIGPVIEMRNVIQTDTQKTSDDIRNAIMISIIIFIAAFAIIILSVMIFSNRFSRRLTEPLVTLREDVSIISGGNLAHRALTVTNDEIGDLATAFNDMTGSLQTYIANLTTITAEKERIGAELNVATQIQASMLPCIFPAFPDRPEFDIYGSMLPAKEVGGDFYDFFLIDNDRLAVVMADVSGKGVPAALFMVIAKTLIKNNAQYGKSPKEVFEIVNNMLCENNEAGMFVTAFMGFLDIPTGTFTYVNAGHNPPLIKRNGGDFEWLPTKPCFVLAGMDGMSYRQDEITLHPGDTLYLYTDGVTEAVNRDEALFSEQRLLDVANKHQTDNLGEFLASIKTEIDLFADGAEQADDITMLVLCYYASLRLS
jgi:sigma-B regulation protein RsbU (phosphoserine phosphatase)